jgi:hypothetical protein
MKNELLKKVLPHVVAILIFLLTAILFCKPALEGNVLGQDDIIGWKGMAQNGFDYKEKTGHFPLWNPNVFSGMPNYLIVMNGKSVLPDMTKIFSLGLPQPINFFFIAAICFYVLCLALRLKPAVGIFGGLAFAYCTFHPVIISAGHVTQMFAIAYSPLLLAGLILIYEKKYWLGLAVTTLGTFMQISSNHPQISYYLFIIALAITISYLVTWIIKKEWKHVGIAFCFAALAAIAGVAANSLSFLVTTEYSKATMRGGKSISINGANVQAAKTTGLDTSYAFQYSMSKPEPLVIFMPKVMGGGNRDVLGEDHSKNVVKNLTGIGVPETSASQVAVNLPRYWGGLEYAGGVPYIGVLIFLLAIIGFVVIRHPLRWALLAVTILSIMMSWGKFFPGFNLLLFENLPLYNKFRAPSMSLVITEIALPLIAVLAAQQLFFESGSREILKKNFKNILYAMGGLTLLLALLYLAMGYNSPMDHQLLSNNWDGSGTDTIGKAIVAGMKKDRSSIFGGQLLRTLGFMVLLLGLLWLYLKNILKPIIALSILAVINLVDLIVIDKTYLNDDNYHSKDELHTNTSTKTPIDEEILKDKDVSYRVFNYGQERFSSSDYHFPTFHKTVGGYHPAKLRIYQDVMERYLYANPNEQVLNMLNVKYVVADNPQNNQKTLVPNPNAYGPVWFVKNVKLVKGDVEEIQSIGITNLKDTAIVKQDFAGLVTQPQWDSAATIKIAKFDNDAIEYSSEAATPQFAVFSEIFYPYGWNAYIDGKKVDFTRANYILRGLSIPAGKHSIKFAFEPETYKKGIAISYAGSWLVLLFVLGGFFMTWWQQRKKVQVKA